MGSTPDAPTKNWAKPAFGHKRTLPPLSHLYDCAFPRLRDRLPTTKYEIWEAKFSTFLRLRGPTVPVSPTIALRTRLGTRKLGNHFVDLIEAPQGNPWRGEHQMMPLTSQLDGPVDFWRREGEAFSRADCKL